MVAESVSQQLPQAYEDVLSKTNLLLLFFFTHDLVKKILLTYLQRYKFSGPLRIGGNFFILVATDFGGHRWSGDRMQAFGTFTSTYVFLMNRKMRPSFCTINVADPLRNIYIFSMTRSAPFVEKEAGDRSGV